MTKGERVIIKKNSQQRMRPLIKERLTNKLHEDAEDLVAAHLAIHLSLLHEVHKQHAEEEPVHMSSLLAHASLLQPHFAQGNRVHKPWRILRAGVQQSKVIFHKHVPKNVVVVVRSGELKAI